MTKFTPAPTGKCSLLSESLLSSVSRSKHFTPFKESESISDHGCKRGLLSRVGQRPPAIGSFHGGWPSPSKRHPVEHRPIRLQRPKGKWNDIVRYRGTQSRALHNLNWYFTSNLSSGKPFKCQINGFIL